MVGALQVRLSELKSQCPAGMRLHVWDHICGDAQEHLDCLAERMLFQPERIRGAESLQKAIDSTCAVATDNE